MHLSKVISRQDADFKLSPSNSNETSINLSNEIADFLSSESKTLTFKIYKADLIKALSAICLLQPLYYKKESESSSEKLLYFYKNWLTQLEKQFAESETSYYAIDILRRDDGRNYLNRLKLGNGFNIRSFLIEKHSQLEFNKSENGELSIRLFSSMGILDAPIEHDSYVEKPILSPIFDAPLQQIFFGAPGTGKSHSIKEECKKHPHYRITFHPDTDYAAFVGSYKPITVEEPVYTNIGTTAHPVIDTATGKQLTQKKITYNYVTQPFLKAYIKAWNEQQNENPQPVFLVIEEINRGNCAQIFGDIFQLLDRNESGYSDYPITTDSDLEKVLAKNFENLTIQNEEAINDIYEDDVISKVKAGTHLLLPNNLYIWATMNTSDQSLFPIDSAFKRRWDWKYIKISKPEKVEYRISVNGKEYDWWEFVQAINRKIEDEGTQEDKKLGYFFAKAPLNKQEIGIISADKFVSKVLFFLYNDVFKDYGYNDDIFKDKNGKEMKFAYYFNHKGEVVEEAVEQFLQNLKVKPISEDSDDESTDMNGDTPIKSGISARINGRKVGTITKALYQILSAVADTYTYDDLYESVKDSLNREEDVMKTIPSVVDYQKENRWYNNPLTTLDSVSFVITNQWKKDLLPQIEKLASTLGVSYENLSE